MLDKRVLRFSDCTGRSVTLREKPANMRVKLVGLPESFTTIRMGGKGKLNHLPYLKEGSWKKTCDYLLLTQICGEDHAVFVELKKSLRSRGDPEEQLLRSRPILEYLLAVCDTEKSGKLLRPSVSYVIVYEHINFDKSPLRPNLSGMIDEIGYKSITIKRFQGRELEFPHLVAS